MLNMILLNNLNGCNNVDIINIILNFKIKLSTKNIMKFF